MLIFNAVATGAAAIMAIRVLLDHDVPEENILIVSLLMAEIGVHSIAYAFPKVKLILFLIFKNLMWNTMENENESLKFLIQIRSFRFKL